MPEPEIENAATPEQHAAHARRFDTLATFPHVRLVIANDPDDPDYLASEVIATRTAPCYADVARVLRGLADEFDRRHAGQPCGRDGA